MPILPVKDACEALRVDDPPSSNKSVVVLVDFLEVILSRELANVEFLITPPSSIVSPLLSRPSLLAFFVLFPISTLRPPDGLAADREEVIVWVRVDVPPVFVLVKAG